MLSSRSSFPASYTDLNLMIWIPNTMIEYVSKDPNDIFAIFIFYFYIMRWWMVDFYSFFLHCTISIWCNYRWYNETAVLLIMPVINHTIMTNHMWKNKNIKSGKFRPKLLNNFGPFNKPRSTQLSFGEFQLIYMISGRYFRRIGSKNQFRTNPDWWVELGKRQKELKKGILDEPWEDFLPYASLPKIKILQ